MQLRKRWSKRPSRPSWLLHVMFGIMLGACALPRSVHAQVDGLLQIGDPVHRFLERQHAQGRLPEAFVDHQPLSAYEALRYLDALSHAAADTAVGVLPPRDRVLLARFRGERAGPGAAWAHARVPGLYENGRDLLSVRGDGYGVQVNPLLHAGFGRAWREEGSAAREARSVWHYARGGRLSGHLGPHVFFETRLTENVSRPVWVQHDNFTAPRLGFVGLADSLSENPTYDYFTATGMVGLKSRFFEVRFGRDRNRWGPGVGSVFLSDYAPVYDQLQIRTTAGRFQYVNLFAGLAEPRFRESIADVIVPRKYAAFHRLAVRLTDRVQVAAFEAVVFATDSLGARQGFDLSYLNPVIFYRAVERDRGSPDNVLLGADASWRVGRGLRLYGQFVLDELVVGRIGGRWWANKWGWLAGAHVAGLPVSGLSIRLELARLRPYFYSHRQGLTSYTHYNDVLGHPAGPNALDAALFADYRPGDRVYTALTVAYTRSGENSGTENFGGDPLLPDVSRASDEDVRMLQGHRRGYLLVEATAGYELLPDLFLEAALRAEALDDALRGRRRYVAPSVLVRWNMPFESVRY